MRGAVDSTRQPGNDNQVMLAKVIGQTPRKAARRRGCVARADYRYRHPVEQIEIALGDQKRRCILQLAE